ncbi:hypothetical protein AX16_010209 [Volvariella volvacea WC 439]|nr:hypothetical protein AX16_010209 [Volvariella volvacea WC 439]
MKIAVTGANGLIGKSVVHYALQRGHTVLALDIHPPRASFQDDQDSSDRTENTNYTYVQVDVRDFKALKDILQKHALEGVIHLAALLPHGTDESDPAALHNANVSMSYNILMACAELGITRIAQASSVNVVNLYFAKKHHFDYFPLDENHPLNPDEPYGLAKVVSELQADSIVRRYPTLRIASLRPSYCVAQRATAVARTLKHASVDLWGYTQLDSVADAFLLAVTVPNSDGLGWTGHEAFFIVAPTVAVEEKSSQELKKEYWKDVPWRGGRALEGFEAFFDSSKATKLLGWIHKDVS